MTYDPGDKSAAICDVCEKRVATTFYCRTPELEVPAIPVLDVLVAVCDGCGSTAGIPSQSIARIAEAREKGSA